MHYFSFFLNFLLFLKLLVYVKGMVDEIQPVLAGSEVDVATNTEARNDKDDGGELTFHPRFQKLT